MADEAPSGHSFTRDLLWNEWRLANRVAHRCEQEIAKRYLASVEDSAGSPRPALKDVLEATRLRKLADDLFAVAMEQTKARAAALATLLALDLRNIKLAGPRERLRWVGSTQPKSVALLAQAHRNRSFVRTLSRL